MSRKSFPYKYASLSEEKCQAEIRALFAYYNVEAFTFGENIKERIVGVEFQYQGQKIRLTVDLNAAANRLLCDEPWSTRRRKAQAEYTKEKLEQAKRQSYRLLLNWLEVSFSLIELGVFKFMDVFMPYYVLIDKGGRERLLGEVIEAKLSDLSKLLPEAKDADS